MVSERAARNAAAAEKIKMAKIVSDLEFEKDQLLKEVREPNPNPNILTLIGRIGS